MNLAIDDEPVLSATRAWLERAVIGLNLCPFAKAVHVHGRIRYLVSRAQDAGVLLGTLASELTDLAESDACSHETTLIVLPQLWPEFADMLSFLEDAERLVRRLEYEGVVQIASFHPAYQFAGTHVDDLENCTNRSPFPILHLLKEESIDRAVAAILDPATIYLSNIRTLQALGREGWRSLSAEIVGGR